MADARVRSPGTLTYARDPAVRSDLDAGRRAVAGSCPRRLPGCTGGGFSFVTVRRLVGMIERTVWPDSDCLARPLGGATIDSRLDQRVYRAMQD
jgi:hypothetical protein